MMVGRYLSMCIVLISLSVQGSAISTNTRNVISSIIFISLHVQGSVIARNIGQTQGAPVVRLPKPVIQIAEVIKKTLSSKSRKEVTKMMKDHLMTMKLINANNVWSSSELKNIGSKLLPGNLNGRDLSDLIDTMAQLAAKNQYLTDFLNQASEDSYSQLKGLVQLEGDIFLPDVTAFAMVLDRLTTSQKENWRVMKSCQEIWDKELGIKDILGVTSPFESIKAITINEVIYKTLTILEESRLKPKVQKEGIVLLSVNILEAILEDLKKGFLANSNVGWTLVRNQPNVLDEPRRISENGQAIEFDLPQGTKWADLYQTWNLAFVSKFPQFPYYFTKLLIPSVSDYQAAPELYLHNRVFALHNFINWGLLLRINEGSNNKFSSMNWFTREVTENWGEQNLQSSQDYELRLSDGHKLINILKQLLHKWHP